MKRTEKKLANQIDHQGKAFIQKARERGCDGDKAAFAERLRKIAKASVKASERD